MSMENFHLLAKSTASRESKNRGFCGTKTIFLVSTPLLHKCKYYDFKCIEGREACKHDFVMRPFISSES